LPDRRLLVTEMGGKVFSFVQDAQATQVDLVMDLNSLLKPKLADQGVALFSATPHPNFGRNRQLFACYVHPGKDRHTRVSRFTLDNSAPPKVVSGSEQVIITWPAGGHNAGCLRFGKEGLLYIATGDGSGPNPPDGRTTGQDISDLLGAILRIDVDRPTTARAYSVPADNPFVDRDGARPEIWAYGLRNPWKFGVDTQTGELFVADNGWESWEMVHRIVRGGNCGWPIREGRAALRTEVTPGPTPIIPPIKDHPHSEANSVIGGPVYRGNKLTELQGSFVYGDYITGTIWALKSDGKNQFSHRTLVDTHLRIVDFAQGSRGELYVLDYDYTGQIYELLPNNLPDRSADFPRLLSETGLFQSLKTMTPAQGVMPYNVQVSRWMDHATARRWVAIPGTATIQLAENPGDAGSYPDGTVFVKHLTLPRARGPALRLETQLLHFENGTWHPYSYLWDETGKDARLVDPIGAQRLISSVPHAQPPQSDAQRTWRVSAQNECKLCHNAGSHFVLGFVANQLHRPAPHERQLIDQLKLLAARKLIGEQPDADRDSPHRLVDPHDDSQPLADRARSYLHANCSMCHHARGNAIVSFYLRRDLHFDKLNTNKGTGIGTFGMRNAKLIVPGDPYRSVLMYRMTKLGYGRMPYIGSHAVDSTGVALVEQWIRSLAPAAEHENASPPLKPTSPEATALKTLASNNSQPADRETAIRTLVKSSEGALALVGHMHANRLSGAEHQVALQHGSRSKRSDIRGLFDHFLPESQRRKTLGPKITPDTILKLTGDTGRGQLIFFSDAARCRACHDATDRVKSTGPTLVEINKKHRRRSDFLDHVLNPSLKIEPPFVTYVVLDTDGRVTTGLLVDDKNDAITLKTAERKTVRIARDNIEEMRKSTRSLMPDRILSDLTAQEAADLISYIRSLGAAP
jgi:putative heme-binding domain-containing protein